VFYSPIFSVDCNFPTCRSVQDKSNIASIETLRQELDQAVENGEVTSARHHEELERLKSLLRDKDQVMFWAWQGCLSAVFVWKPILLYAPSVFRYSQRSNMSARSTSFFE